jgi:hypothetical protein
VTHRGRALISSVYSPPPQIGTQVATWCAPGRDCAIADFVAVLNCPGKACRQNDVGCRESIAHEVGPAIRQREVYVPELMAKIFTRLRDDGGSLAIDVGQTDVHAVAAHNIEAGRIQFRDDEKTPLEPLGLKRFFLRYQSVPSWSIPRLNLPSKSESKRRMVAIWWQSALTEPWVNRITLENQLDGLEATTRIELVYTVLQTVA